MKKHKVIEAIKRRMADYRRIIDNPQASKAMRIRAQGAWHALLDLKIEIEDMDTKQEKTYYPTSI